MAGSPPPPGTPASPLAGAEPGNPAGGGAPSLPFFPPPAPVPAQEARPVAGGPGGSVSPAPAAGGLAAGGPGEDLAVLSEIADVLCESGDDPDGSFWRFIYSKLRECKDKVEDHGEQHVQTREATVVHKENRSKKVLDTSKKYISTIRLQHEDTTCSIDPSVVPLQTSCSGTDPTDMFPGLSFSSTCSELDINEASRKKERDMAKKLVSILHNLFEWMMDEKMCKQLMKTIERMEKVKPVREEAWRHQQLELAKRELELRMQEQVLDASREQALLSFFEKISGHIAHMLCSVESSQMEIAQTIDTLNSVKPPHMNVDPSNRRWKRCEVNALIKIRVSMEDKIESANTSGGLWGEISSNLSSMGYTRSAKKCKEKWNNINKYFKRAKLTIKKRLPDPRTHQYFRELEIFHRGGTLDPDAEARARPVATHESESSKENIVSTSGLPSSSLGEKLNPPPVQHNDHSHISSGSMCVHLDTSLSTNHS